MRIHKILINFFSLISLIHFPRRTMPTHLLLMVQVRGMQGGHYSFFRLFRHNLTLLMYFPIHSPYIYPQATVCLCFLTTTPTSLKPKPGSDWMDHGLDHRVRLWIRSGKGTRALQWSYIKQCNSSPPLFSWVFITKLSLFSRHENLPKIFLTL